ncbi:hypothetical protein AADZ90_004990 [Aestuariibius sp. 2305UL40-4]|uniref:hypothetical protein n=1 Tax=Aestuariibius violaceus TaxID=3234132 RepID=UPI00348FD028
MIAMQALDAFDGLLDNIAGLAESDSLNADPQPYDETTEEDFPYLTKDAIPDDPSKAAIIGIIDDALPFAHEQFRVGKATSRIASVWFQDAFWDPTNPVGQDLPFGKELRGGQITQLLKELQNGTLKSEGDLYRKAGVLDLNRPVPPRLALTGGHGASVGGLAAGVSPKDPDLGQALPIIATCLPPAVIRDTLGFAAPFYIILGTLQIIFRARRLCRWIERVKGLPANSVRLPVLINLSFGLTAGPKDGSSLMDQLFDAIADVQSPDLGPVRFLIAMGNHRLSRVRARVPANAAEPLDWSVKPDDRTASFVEIWGAPGGTRPPSQPMQIEVTPPGQSTAITTTFASHGTYQNFFLNGREIARAYLQFKLFEGRGREVITLVVPPTVPEKIGEDYGVPGRWQLRVIAPAGAFFDCYIQRDDTVPGFGVRRGRQSRFQDPDDPIYAPDGRPILFDPPGKMTGGLRMGTINAFACGRNQIRVGGLYEESCETVPYSALGFEQPQTAAEGDVRASSAVSTVLRSLPVMGMQSGGRWEMAGTSMATPIVTRALAQAFIDGAVTDDSHTGLVKLLRSRVPCNGPPLTS